MDTSALIATILKQGLLGAIVIAEAVVIYRLNSDRERLYKCIFDLQNERLTDSKQQLEIVNSLREMFEAALKALRAVRA